MIYVYDTPMTGRDTTRFKRYGVTYKFEQRFVMGSRTFYRYSAPGAEPLLVVPDFVVMYISAQKKLAKLPKNGNIDYDYAKSWVKNIINPTFAEEEIPDDESDSGFTKQLICDYKDIKVTFEYRNRTLFLGKEFEIRDNNIFGNGIVVNMDVAVDEE